MKAKYKSFTIIELIISITLFSLIILASFESLNVLNVFNEKLETKIIHDDKIEKNIKLLIEDMSNAIDFSIYNIKDNFDDIHLKTRHSLYDINIPSIYYYVKENQNNQNVLYRIETKFQLNRGLKIKDIFQREDLYLTEKDKGFRNFYIDKVMENIEVFKIQEKKSNYEEDKKKVEENFFKPKEYILIIKEFNKESLIIPISKKIN